MEGFFFHSFNRFVRRGAPFILAGILAWLGVAAFFASRMRPLSAEEVWLPSSNPRQRAIELLNSQFPKSPDDELIIVTLFWGVQGIDKSRVGRWDQVYYGDIVWDLSFSLAQPLEQ